MLVHYADLLADLEGEMRRLAGRLGIDVPEDGGRDWSRRRGSTACARAPTSWSRTRSAILKDPSLFFRSGRSGTGRRC